MPSAKKERRQRADVRPDLLFVVSAGRPAGSAFAGDTSRRALSVRGVGGKIDVFFRGRADVETRDVDELVADADMALADQNAGVVDGLGQPLLVHFRLEATFEELLGSQLQHLIEFELVVLQQSVTVHPPQQGGTFKNALRIIRFKSQQSTGGLTELRQGILNAPDFPFTAQSILPNQLELSIQTFLLVRTTRRLERLAVCFKEAKRQMLVRQATTATTPLDRTQSPRWDAADSQLKFLDSRVLIGSKCRVTQSGCKRTNQN